MANLAQILTKKYLGWEWTVSEDDYNSLIWYPGNTLPKPTEAELRAFDAEVSLELRWDVVRNRRNKLLSFCDWTQLADCPLTPEKRVEWTTYRQALRNVPQQGVNPEQVVWPTQP
jgi:hypothetical protein